jgi:hypothetical protein
MKWQHHEWRTSKRLQREAKRATIIDQFPLRGGRRADHVMVNRRGKPIALTESKCVAELKHAHVDQVLDYAAELGEPDSITMSICADTYVPPSVAERMEDEGIGLMVMRRLTRSKRRSTATKPLIAVGGGALAGLAAREIAARNGARNPDAWGWGVGLFTTLLLGLR